MRSKLTRHHAPVAAQESLRKNRCASVRRHLSGLEHVAGSTRQDRCYSPYVVVTRSGERRGQCTRSHRVTIPHRSRRHVMAPSILRITRPRTRANFFVSP
jgi:hypothetical protein